MYIYNNTIFKNNIVVWKRFLDDVWVLWRGSVDQLKTFFNYLNNCSDFLKFTMDFDSSRISFLDLWIIHENNTLYTDIFIKPTARNSLLRAASCHPLPLKNSLPYSQFCRVKRICSRQFNFDKNMTEMKKKFGARGYKSTQINSAVDRINTRPRPDLFQRKVKNKKSSIIFSTKYSKQSEKIEGTIKKHWHILQSDPNFHQIYTHPPLVVFKRGSNLRDYLVRSDLAPTLESSQRLLIPIPDGNRRCGSCAQCNYTYRCSTYRHPHSCKSIPIRGIITCHTKSVIYLITCPCGKTYVGKTSRELKTPHRRAS